MISVIVPAYNAENFLARTLDTVLAQTLPDWELLIVNDGSKDGTQAVADAYAARDTRIRALSKPNGGCAAARNYGLEQAAPNAEYILFLDHDDLWEARALQTLLDTARALPECVGAVGGARVIQDAQAKQDATLDALRQNTRKEIGREKTLAFADMVTLNHIWTMGQVLIKRSALRAVGPLDPQTAPADDWDIYLRLTMRGALAATDTPVIHWRSHVGNTSNDGEKMQRAMACVRAKLLNSPDISAEQRRLAMRCFDNAQRNLSTLQWRWAWESLTSGNFGQAFRQAGRAFRNYARSLRGSQA